MADISDVVTALANGVSSALYPNGTTSPPIAGEAVAIVEGWPLPADLDDLVKNTNTDFALAQAIVAVWPVNDETNETKYASDWGILSPAPAPTLSVSVDATGTQATIGGTAPGPTGPLTNIGLLVNGKGYPYRVLPGDDLPAIASALAALVNADTPASAAGAVVSVPGAHQLVSRLGTFTTLARETKRQRRTVRIICWSGSDALREAVTQAVDQVYADVQWLVLPDGTGARIRYLRSPMFEDEQKAGLYRREIWFSVEYPTITTVLSPSVLFTNLELQGGFPAILQTPQPPPIRNYTA